MAVDSSCEGEPRIEEFLNGNSSLPASCSCLKLLKSSPADANQQFPLEIPPIVVEETSLPTGLYHPSSGSPGQDVYSISVLSKDDVDAQCASSPAFLSILEVPNQSKRPMCLDTRLNCQKCIDFQMKSEEVYSPCIIDVPSENENSFSPESYEEGIESCKTDNLLARLLWRQASFKFDGRDKSVTEKAHDIPNNRWRRYKRSASFDSRKVALLFSILSSLGSLVLIYLTLRLRQRDERVSIPGKAAAIFRNKGCHFSLA